MVTKQLEKEGARPTLLDPLEVGAPLLAQPLHFMASFIVVLHFMASFVIIFHFMISFFHSFALLVC